VSGYEQLARYLRSWADVPGTELARIRTVFRPMQAGPGELLVRAGDPPSEVHFVVDGLVRVFYVDAEGVERTKAFRAENRLVCAFSAVLRGEPSQLFVETMTTSSLLVATREAFDRMVAGHPCWREVVSRITEQLYVEEERQRWELLTNDAATRYRHFLAEQPALAARLTQRQIASFLRITPESLSRIRARLT
jgi:CRP-like cAMP-binding protein